MPVAHQASSSTRTIALHEAAREAQRRGEDLAVLHVVESLLELTDKVGAGLLVIGARCRSPVGKALLGSVTQTLILQADVPVLVVKSDE